MYSQEVEHLYKLYPTKCPVRGASSGKTKKNKEKIKKLLEKGEYDFGELEYAIKKYHEDCVEHRVYMKNFSTFLNNVPDYTEIVEEEKTDEQKYLSEEEQKIPDYSVRQKLIYERKRK